MIFNKFLFLFSVFMLLAGCTTGTESLLSKERVGKQGTCGPPLYKSEGDCFYLLQVKRVPEGNNPAVGVVPKAVVDDNREQQEMMNKSVVFDKYPFDELTFRVPEGDENKLRKDYYYSLRGTPSDKRSFDNNYLLIDQEFSSEAELKKYLADLRKLGMP